MCLGAPGNPSLPVFSFCVEIRVYLQGCETSLSFFDSFTCSSAALFGVLTSHTIPFKSSLFVVPLRLPGTADVSDEGGRKNEEQIMTCQAVRAPSLSFCPLRLPPGESFQLSAQEPCSNWLRGPGDSSFRHLTSWLY